MLTRVVLAADGYGICGGYIGMVAVEAGIVVAASTAGEMGGTRKRKIELKRLHF